MYKVRAFLVLGLIIIFGGLAFGQKITSTFDKDYGLSRLKTYEFRPEERIGSDPLATDTVTEKKIKEALDDELQINGYHPPTEGVWPDFLISFHVRTKDKTDERGPDRKYVQGSLIVDFYEAGTGKLVWRGVATGVIGEDTVDLKLAEDKAKGAAKLLLEQFGKDLLEF